MSLTQDVLTVNVIKFLVDVIGISELIKFLPSVGNTQRWILCVDKGTEYKEHEIILASRFSPMLLLAL